MNKHVALGSLLLLPLLAGCASQGSAGEDPGAESDALKKCAAGATVKGVDVSYYQGHVDWAKVHASGVSFAIARVGDGDSYIDPQFATNWSGMKAAGVVRGTYHFFRPGQDPVAQANSFVKEINAHGGMTDADLPPVADVEVQDGVSDATLRSHLLTWLQHVESALHRRPMIYTAPGFWDGIGADGSFSKYTLWVANWETSCPSMPNSWSGWKFWQKADNGAVPGISGHVDVDEFNGSLSALKAFASGSAPSSIPTVASIGGDIAGQPAVGKNPDGRLEVFAVGAKGNLLTSFQSAAGGKFGDWYSLGGDLEGRPAIINEKDGRLEVFARSAGGALEHAVQDAPNGKLGAFKSLGGAWTSDPAVAKNEDGRLEVFAASADGAIHHAHQTAADGATWSSWASIGTAGGGLGAPQVILGDDGKLRVLALGKNGATYLSTQGTSAWTAWASLGGDTTEAPTVAKNEDGRLEAFVRGTNGHLYHASESTPGGAWTAWASLGGGVRTPAASTDADGRIEVFVRGDNNALYRIRQKAPNGAWEGFTEIGGAMSGAPTAARNKDGRLEVFYRATDGSVHHAAEKSPETW